MNRSRGMVVLPTATVERGEVLEFLGIAFGVTAALHGALAATGRPFSLESADTGLYLVGLVAPSAAAVIVEGRRRGRAGVRQLLDLARLRHAPLPVVVAAAAVPPLLAVAGILSSTEPVDLAIDPVMVIGQLWVVAGEELGWRGWLWPRLVDHFGADRGTAATTLLWGLWHLPMFAVAASPQAEDGALAFTLAIAAWGTVHGLLQLRARSVLTAMVFHASANIAASSVELRDRSGLLATYAVTTALGMWWLRRQRLISPGPR